MISKGWYKLCYFRFPNWIHDNWNFQIILYFILSILSINIFVNSKYCDLLKIRYTLKVIYNHPHLLCYSGGNFYQEGPGTLSINLSFWICKINTNKQSDLMNPKINICLGVYWTWTWWVQFFTSFSFI